MFRTGSIEANSKKEYFSFIISGSINCLAVYSYFKNFPLFTQKKESFYLWKEVHEQIINKNHLDLKYLPILIEKAKSINSINKSVK
jgi:hypothetical protein